MDIDESILQSELGKIINQKNFQDRNRYPQPYDIPQPRPTPPVQMLPKATTYFSEREIVKLLLKFGSRLHTEEKSEKGAKEDSLTIADYIVGEIMDDGLKFDNAILGEIFSEVLFQVQHGLPVSDQHFVRHANPEISSLSADMLSDPYELSKLWTTGQGYVRPEDEVLRDSVEESVLKFKADKLVQMRNSVMSELREASAKEETEKVMELQKKITSYGKILNIISQKLGNRTTF